VRCLEKEGGTAGVADGDRNKAKILIPRPFFNLNFFLGDASARAYGRALFNLDLDGRMKASRRIANYVLTQMREGAGAPCGQPTG